MSQRAVLVQNEITTPKIVEMFTIIDIQNSFRQKDIHSKFVGNFNAELL